MKTISETQTIQNIDLMRPARIGDLVDGAIVGSGQSKVYVDLGTKGTGIIFGREFYAARETLRKLKTGDKIFAKIVDTDNDEGYVELSLSEAGREIGWERLQRIKEMKTLSDSLHFVMLPGSNEKKRFLTLCLLQRPQKTLMSCINNAIAANFSS